MLGDWKRKVKEEECYLKFKEVKSVDAEEDTELRNTEE